MWSRRGGVGARNEYEKQAVDEEVEERKEVGSADIGVFIKKGVWEVLEVYRLRKRGQGEK